jgi:hypothetical protein
MGTIDLRLCDEWCSEGKNGAGGGYVDQLQPISIWKEMREVRGWLLPRWQEPADRC